MALFQVSGLPRLNPCWVAVPCASKCYNFFLWVIDKEEDTYGIDILVFILVFFGFPLPMVGEILGRSEIYLLMHVIALMKFPTSLVPIDFFLFGFQFGEFVLIF